MNVDELVAALRGLDGMAPEEQEIRAFDAALKFLRASAPEIAAERLDAPLLRLFELAYDKVMDIAQFDGVGGNRAKLEKEFPILMASAAEVVLVEMFGVALPEARSLVLDACPEGITRMNLRDWSSPSKRLDEGRQKLRLMLISTLRNEAENETAVLDRVQAAFKRLGVAAAQGEKATLAASQGVISTGGTSG